MKVNEIFYSLQGEGAWAGCAATFVRLSGCNRACGFCDTDFSAYVEMTAAEIVAAVEAYPAEIVVITGGEPALQLTDELVEGLHAAGKRVHVETNGSLPLPEGVDWITCSPKRPPYGLERVDELKVLYGTEVDPEEMRARWPRARVYALQPLAGSDPAGVVEYIKRHPHWRLSLQLHKLLHIR